MSDQELITNERKLFAALVSILSGGVDEKVFNNLELDVFDGLSQVWDKYCNVPVAELFTRPDFAAWKQKAIERKQSEK